VKQTIATARDFDMAVKTLFSIEKRWESSYDPQNSTILRFH
jgi:hypothetical protein